MNREFLFYTGEGQTISPTGVDIENFQILGVEAGENSGGALREMLRKNPWIYEAGFDSEKIEWKELA